MRYYLLFSLLIHLSTQQNLNYFAIAVKQPGTIKITATWTDNIAVDFYYDVYDGSSSYKYINLASGTTTSINEGTARTVLIYVYLAS